MEQERYMLNEYIEILNKDEQDMTAEDYQTIYYVENNDKLRDIVKSIHSTSSTSDRYQLVYDFIEQEQSSYKSEDEQIKEALQKEFGIDLTNIERKKLNSGIDVLIFYDRNINRKRLIDYTYAKSLVSEFTAKQNENDKFQSSDYKKNSDDIALDEANKNSKRELEMIDIDRAKSEYGTLLKRIKDQDPMKIQCMHELIKESKYRNIKFVNFENNIALDEDGNVIEAVYNIKDKKVDIKTPETYKTTTEEVTNEEIVKDNYNPNDNNDYNNQEEYNIEPTETETNETSTITAEDINLTEEMNRYYIRGDKDQIFENVKKYAQDIDSIERDYYDKIITDDEFNFYGKVCTSYNDLIEAKEKQKTNANVKKLTYTPDAGFISILIISVLAIIFCIIAFMQTL